MSTQEEATKAIEGMHGKMIEGRPLYVALHQTKEDRTAMFVQRQHAAMSRSMNMPPQQYMMVHVCFAFLRQFDSSNSSHP